MLCCNDVQWYCTILWCFASVALTATLPTVDLLQHATDTIDSFAPHWTDAVTFQGNLNLSRAIGDLMYKADEGLRPEEQMITADPELRTLELTPDDEFVILACDGVWNSLSSQEVHTQRCLHASIS